MLLALVTAQRTQTLSKLDTSCMQETTTGITFTIRDTLKTTRPGKHLAPIEIRSFAPDSRLWPGNLHQTLHQENTFTAQRPPPPDQLHETAQACHQLYCG